MTRQWDVQGGKVKVVEDARTASLVVVGRDLESRAEKAAALREVLRKLEA